MIFLPGPFYPENYCCEAVDVSIQLKSPFTLGQVESGSITLKGQMVNAQWQPGYDREYENFVVLGDQGFGILMRAGVWMMMSRNRFSLLVLRWIAGLLFLDCGLLPV